MKRVVSLVLGVVLIFTLVGCVDTTRQDAILKYVNEDLVSVAELESQFHESYSSVSGDNYIDDQTMYEEISNNTVVYARRLNDAVTELAAGIEYAELLEIHKLYMEACNHNLSAITMIIAALENQDYAQISAANELLGKANTLLIDFNSKLTILAEANGVTIE